MTSRPSFANWGRSWAIPDMAGSASSLKGQSASLHGSDHGLSKDEVSHVRKFIESCGIEPSRDFPI